MANTPPYRKGPSSRKFLSLFLILFLAVGNAWGQETVISLQGTTSAPSKKVAQIGTQDAYFGRCGNSVSLVANGLATGNSTIFVAFEVKVKSKINLTCYCTAGSSYTKEEYISTLTEDNWNSVKKMLAEELNSTPAKALFETNFSKFTISYDKNTQKNKSYDILLDGEYEAGYYAIYLKNSINSAFYIQSITITPSAPDAGGDSVCPETLTISSKDSKTAFLEGDAIELTAALSAGNGAITYQWYKGGTDEGNKLAGRTTAKLEIASCVEGDAGDYYCIASKDDCSDAVNAAAFTITVEADTKCFNMPAITSKPSNLASVTVTGGTLSDISVNGKSVSMDGNGLKFGGNDSRLKVTLTGASIVEGTKITVAWKGASAGSAGVGLFNENLASQVISISGGEAAGSVSHTFTAEEAANYADEFIINRNASGSGICINAITVEDCGPAIVKHTVTLNYNDGETPAGSLTVVDGNAAVKPADPTRGKYTFLGWFVGDTDDEYVWSTAVTGDLTLKAHWQDPWTITFDADGGSAVSGITVKHNTKAEKPTDPTKDANDFLGWFYGDPAVEFDWDANVTQNYALVAQWQPAVAKYDVEYYDGETKIGTEEQVWENQHPTAAGIETAKPLYTFVGWYLTSALEGDPVVLNTVTPVEGLKLYGKWTKAYATSYDMEAYAVSDGATLETLLSNLDAAGYAYTNVNGIDNGHTHNYIYDGMKYKTNDGDLSFNVNAGKLVIVKTGNLPANALTMYINGEEDPTVFVGANEAEETHVNNYFYSEADALYRLDIQASKGTCVLKAVTITDPFTVTFEANGGDAVAALEGKPSITLPEPTNGTMNFKGWYDAATEGNKIGDAGEEYTPTADVTIYAQWEAQSTINTLSDLKVNGETVLGFAADEHTYRMVLPYKSALPMITSATPTNANAKVALWPIDGPEWTDEYDGGCYRQQVVVTPQDPTAEKGYYDIRITYAPKDGVAIISIAVPNGNGNEQTIAAANITGYIGGTATQKLQSGGTKLGSNGHYIGFTLANSETLKEGDVIRLNVSATNGASHLTLYQNASDANPVKDIEWAATTGVNLIPLPAEAAGLSTLYIYRKTAVCNPNLSEFTILRPTNPILKAITIDGRDGEIDEDNKKVTVELPFSSNVASLEVEPTIAWNAPAATNAIVVNDGSDWVVGDNTYVLTDKDGDQTTYTITLTKAAASSDATLKTLTINGNALTLVDGVYEYDYELPYGTTTAPIVVAEANDANATAVVTSVSLTEAVITVTAENGATQEYVINFTVSPWQNIVIWDGSTMDAVAASPDASGLTWEVNGFGDIANYTTTCGTKTYSKVLPSGGSASDSRNFKIVIPDGYLAKFYIAFASHSDGGELRGMSIGTTINKNLDTSIYGAECNTRSEALGGTSVIVGAGTYYINPIASIDFCEVSVLLRPGYIRTGLTVGSLGTICLPSNVPAGQAFGATFYKLVGKEPQYGKIVFDEILSGELEKGKPYLFQAQGETLYCFYGTESVTDPDDTGAMKGTFVDMRLTDLTNIYYFAQKALWSCVDLTSLSVPANRAYVKMDEMPAITESNPAPGVRRITLGVNGQQVATGVDQVQGDGVPTKMIINGQLFILRGEKMYDAQGKLVK